MDHSLRHLCTFSPNYVFKRLCPTAGQKALSKAATKCDDKKLANFQENLG